MLKEETVLNIKGVGVKTAKILSELGINTINDLLLYFPRNYKYYAKYKSLQEIQEGELAIIRARIKEIKGDIRINNKIISTVVFEVEDKLFYGKWFNQPYIKGNLILNSFVFVQGKFSKFKGIFIVINPSINLLEPSSTIIPIYPLKEGITSNSLAKFIKEALTKSNIKENLPQSIVEEADICSLDFAIKVVHFPKNKEELFIALRRLKFQEVFVYLAKIKIGISKEEKDKFCVPYKIAEEMKNLKLKIPFELTKAQSNVIREILIEQKKGIMMNRLVQGDVGSGKTIVALIAAFNAIKNGYQVVLMAPTEILASQHYESAQNLFSEFNIKTDLLTGSLNIKKKRELKDSLTKGDINFLIGTHALLEEDVQFKNLGLVITDEQHRFGVAQRAKIMNKGSNVHTIVMTATPIPRTLALYLFSDLKVSIINELPKDRKKPTTLCYSTQERDKAYKFSLTELKSGRQIYVVSPLVYENEESELSSVTELKEELSKTYYRGYVVEVLHGKMKASLKESIMNKFKNGKIHVLISTTVIEVGVNVTNATVMIIENAERFGLSQLHQLRGRVCRGKYNPYCILISNMKSKISKERMEIIKESSDGFYIAEQDLKLRGYGEIFGVSQSGPMLFKLVDIIKDYDIIKLAYESANKVFENKNPQYGIFLEELGKNMELNKENICFN